MNKNNIYNINSKFKKSRGITLIALVVTIVVILILAGIAISIWSCFLGVGVKAVTENSTQNVLEDYHRGKIETVITTVQSEGNLIKQDTVYRYK